MEEKTLNQIRKKLWWATAILFVLIVILLVPLQMAPLPLKLDALWMGLLGITLAVDAVHGFKIDSFLLISQRIKGPLAKIGNGLIFFVGVMIAIGGLSSF